MCLSPTADRNKNSLTSRLGSLGVPHRIALDRCLSKPLDLNKLAAEEGAQDASLMAYNESCVARRVAGGVRLELPERQVYYDDASYVLSETCVDSSGDVTRRGSI
jgi:hypothetical protein